MSSAEGYRRPLRLVSLHVKFIHPFVQNNKTDATDARAIWTAVQQPSIRTVTVKTAVQQAVLGLRRARMAEFSGIVPTFLLDAVNEQPA